MKTPLISIVLPTYNGSRYIEQSIESCLQQTYRNWELIIVDDASTDDTPAKISRYTELDNRIRSIRNSPNRKLPGSLNRGFAQAKGDYFTWTSDDNYYRPEALAEMVAFLEAQPDVDMVYTDYTEIDEQDHPRWRVSVREPEELAVTNCVGACFLYRPVVHEKLGGYAEDLFLAEDYDFWLRASSLFRLRPLYKDLYVYRVHSQSLTAQNTERVRRVVESTLERNLPHMKSSMRIKVHLRLAKGSQERGDMAKTRSHLLHLLRYSPASFFRYGYADLAVIFLGPRGAGFLRFIYRAVLRLRGKRRPNSKKTSV